MPAHFWPQLTFRDREFKGRGLLTCACFKAEPTGDCWSDLWFDAEGILAVWPAKAETVADTLSLAHDERTSQRQDAGGVGKRPRGRKPNKFEQVKEAMRVDLRQGRRTVADLQEMLEKDLAGTYGVSRDTARRARNAVVAEFDGNSIPDK